jgi:hypothetical protein
MSRLLAYDDVSFVQFAYQLLLGREPDAEGLETYIERLRTGVSKTEIISELMRSSEGMARGIQGSMEAGALEAPVGAPWHAAAEAATTWEDFEFKFDASFIFGAYQTLLGRDPDPEGLSHYLLHLRRGKSKIHILAELMQSAEYRARDGHLKQLHRALRVRENAQTGADNYAAMPKEPATYSSIGTTTREVLAFSADAFVTHVSQHSLGILPDRRVIAEYVARMKAGLSKAQVLTEIMNSGPAKRRATLLHRISRETRRRRLAQIPIIGQLMKMLFDIEGDSAIEQRLRRIENRLFSNETAIEKQSGILDRGPTAVISKADRQGEPSNSAPGLESRHNAEYVPVVIKRTAVSLRSLPEPQKWVDEKDNV